jgi:trehalose-phosphatase
VSEAPVKNGAVRVLLKLQWFMKAVFEYWQEVAWRIRDKHRIFLALDYDGVLSPIASEPGLAILSAENRALLEGLVKNPRTRVAIISGRSLSDVRNHVGAAGIIYAGNHGAEIDLNNSPESHVGIVGFRDELVNARNQLAESFAGFQGAFVEDKGFGIGLHYREIHPEQLDAFHEQFSEWSKQLSADLQILRAKKVYEVRPKIAWNKGNAVWHTWQSAAPDALPICLGDDLTDEDGFRVLQGKGVNIYVGEERQSYAEYILQSPAEVTVFLRRLLAEMQT